MPAYDPSPFKVPPQLLIPGQNAYLFGSYSQDSSPTRIQVATVALTADVVTVSGTVTGGNVPLVGALISIRGTQTGSGSFNVTNKALTAVTFTASTSAITVTFTLSSANVATTADSGLAIVTVAEIPETTASGTASIAVAVQNNETFLQSGRQVSVTVIGTGTYNLQGANFDQPSEYTSLGACTDNAVTQFGPYNFRFYRAIPTASGSAVVRIVG